MQTYKCNHCGKDFESKKGCKSRIPKFCSSKCYGESMKYNLKCKLCGEIIKNNHSVSIINRKYCSIKCRVESRRGVKLSEEWKKALSEGRKKSNKCKGINLYNWKGGKATESIRMKKSIYKRKKSLKKELPIEYLNKILVVQNNKCFFCECDLTDYKAIEHLTPISRGGDNDFYNLVYSCKSCNSKKRQQTLEEYALNTDGIGLLLKWENTLIECL